MSLSSPHPPWYLSNCWKKNKLLNLHVCCACVGQKRELPPKKNGGNQWSLHWDLRYEEGHSTTPVVAAAVVGIVGMVVVGMMV